MLELEKDVSNPAAHLCGAIMDPGEAQVFQDSLTVKVYSALPRESGAGKSRYLWDYVRQVLGSDFHELQTTGTCASKAIQRAIVILMCVRIALQNMGEKFPGTPASEPIFGGGRIEIGKGRLGTYNPRNGAHDGLVVGWGLDWVMKYGIIIREVYKDLMGVTLDLTKPDDQLAEKWGTPGVGVPDFLEPIAKLMPVEDAAPIKSVEEGRDAIYNGEPLFGGSNMTPDPNRPRDSKGYIALPFGGGHATVFDGFNDQEEWVFYNNASWYPVDGPNPDNFPVYGGKVSYKTFDRMLRQGEWYALSSIKGMPNQAALFDMM